MSVKVNFRGRLIELVSFLVVFCVFPLSDAFAEDGRFRFLAVGDLPSSPAQEKLFRKLLKQSESEDFEFLMHVGDIKAGNAPCTDASFENVQKMFRTYPKPIVYTPGDNEWTDCRGEGVDPVERLGKIRKLFFEDKKTLRLDALKPVHQSRDKKFGNYIENYQFLKSRVLFIVTHIVGSNNNRNPKNATAMKEFNDRNAANLAFLRDTFRAGIAEDVAAVAVVIHANPSFEVENPAVEKPAYELFLGAMREFLGKYQKPVVCIHGDTHTYRVDQPLKDAAGQPYKNFRRMEVFGSPAVAGVTVTVNPDRPNVFGFEPYYLKKE